MKTNFIFIAFITILFACQKQTLETNESSYEKTSFEINERNVHVLNNHLNYPWEILWGSDNYIWFTEREGNVSRMNPATGQVFHVATIKDVATTTNYNGLLGMALHPDFSNFPYVFLVYNYFGPGGLFLEKVVRFTYDGTTLISPLVVVDSIIGKRNGNYIHNGSRLVIGPDMMLYVSTGDANHRYELPQNSNLMNGKILRVHLDGSIPADNPYGNAVWAIGQRNPQGLVFANGRLYSSMHGETTNDEINIIKKGGNYGWPYVEGYCDLASEQEFCNSHNVIEPIYAWTPTIAPSGLDYYNHDALKAWKNSLLVAILKEEKLVQLKLNAAGTMVESEKDFFVKRFGRLRDIAISPAGEVYMCTDNGNHKDMIIRLGK